MRSACATASALALLCACATAAPVEGDGHGGGLITQPEVLDLVGCSCVDKFIDAQLSATARKPWSSPSPYAGIHRGDRGYAWRSAANGTETPPRLYYFNQERSTNAGLHHQRSNLKTGIIMEGLLLGRAVVLGAIPLDKNHNFNLPIVRNRWSDYVSLDKSTFVLRDRRNGGREVCKGTLASCVADLHADQHAVLRAAAHMRVPYIDTVMAAQNAAEPFLERNATLPGRKPDVNLIRRMPPWRAHQDNYEIAIDWSPSHHIRRTVKEILAELERRSTTGKVAVVHVRRGDKLSRAKYCGDQIAMATSPAHIAKVLGRIGLPPGTTLYIMSNENNWSHFEPLVSVHGYNYLSHKDFPRLSRLLEGCTPDAIALAASSNVDDDTVACCENNMLFSTEEHLMSSVPYEHRITTMQADPNAILGGSAHTLMSDFWDDCQASKKKSG